MTLAPPGSITPLVFEDQERNLLAICAVPEPHENWKAMLMAGRIEAWHVERFGSLLGTIHRESTARERNLERVFADQSFFESLRVEPYYTYSAQQSPAAADFLNELIARTRLRRLALVHGDYSPKNILLRDQRMVLLDHEVIHWGDPAFDVGFAMAHFLSKSHRFPEWRNDLREAALKFWGAYGKAIARDPRDANLQTFAVRHTLGCLLARAIGRSPLEYLDAEQRQRQKDAVVQMMRDTPGSVESVIDKFIVRISQ